MGLEVSSETLVSSLGKGPAPARPHASRSGPACAPVTCCSQEWGAEKPHGLVCLGGGNVRAALGTSLLPIHGSSQLTYGGGSRGNRPILCPQRIEPSFSWLPPATPAERLIWLLSTSASITRQRPVVGNIDQRPPGLCSAGTERRSVQGLVLGGGRKPWPPQLEDGDGCSTSSFVPLAQRAGGVSVAGPELGLPGV